MASGSDSDDVAETSPPPPPIPPQTKKNKGKAKRKETDEEIGSKAVSPKKSKTWSDVWSHFTRLENDKTRARCNYCKKVFLCPSSNGTTNLKKHNTVSCKAFNVWEAANKFKTQTVFTPDGSDGSLRICKVSEGVFREATNEMVVLAEMPLAFVESLAWKHFCSKTHLYKPHSRRTATRDIVKMYVERKAAVKKILGDNSQRLSLTTDIWVAPHTGASYMVITAHFIDTWWQVRKLIIGFKNVVDHKGATISRVLLDCMAEWDIKRVFCITVDNATANSNAMDMFMEEFTQIGDDALVLNGEFLHLRCATHIINLGVRDGMMEIASSVNAIRNGIYFVRSSSLRQKAFENHVESKRIQRGSLPLDVRTRWNSTYMMLEQALKFRLAFDKMQTQDLPYVKYFKEIVEGGKKRIGPPTKDDWDSVHRLVQFLIIFYKATLVLSVSNTACSHKLYHAIVTMTRNITLLSTSPGPDEVLREKALLMLDKLAKYWNPFDKRVKMNRLILVAAVFDPSKKLKFVEKCFFKLYGKDSPESAHLKDEVLAILKRLYDEYSSRLNKNRSGEASTSAQFCGTSSSSGQTSQCREEVSKKTVLGNGLQYESMDDIYNELVEEGGFQKKLGEVDLYLEENVENPKSFAGTEYDVLSWWKVNSGKFPVLSLIARDILAMQVSSVASESAFSTSGRVLEPSRSCLTHYTIEVLMCTEQWLKCELKINDKGVVKQEQLLAELEVQDELMREFEPAFTFQAPLE